MSPWLTFANYDSGRDGQVAVGTVTVTGPNSSADSGGWFDATGISHIVIRAAVAGGTTTFTVEQSREGGSSSALVSDTGITSASAAAAGGAEVAVSYPYVRIKIVQTVATSTNMQVGVKGEAK